MEAEAGMIRDSGVMATGDEHGLRIYPGQTRCGVLDKYDNSCVRQFQVLKLTRRR